MSTYNQCDVYDLKIAKQELIEIQKRLSSLYNQEESKFIVGCLDSIVWHLDNVVKTLEAKDANL